MLASAIPTRIPLPFAESGARNAIPAASQIGITPGAASLADGFPPLTRTPLAAGGVPPFGQDFNGILWLTSAWARWNSAGGQVTYDSAFSTAIGGYPAGAVVKSAGSSKLWRSTADNNTTDPDASGAGWVPLSAGSLLNVQFFNSSGTYTPTPGTASIIVEGIGGGGAGGGVPATGAGSAAAGAGGTEGAWGTKRITSGIGSRAVTIGAAGTGVSGGNGGNGTATSFGSDVTFPGGPGGGAGVSLPGASSNGTSSSSSTPSGQDFGGPGTVGMPGITLSASAALSGAGGGGHYGVGGGASGTNGTSTLAGAAASGKGSGGGGAVAVSSGVTMPGGNGGPGYLVVWEYT